MSWALIIWLGVQSNNAIYAEFETQQACEQKREQVQRALDQAKSTLKLSCISQNGRMKWST